MNIFSGIGRLTKDPVLHHVGHKQTPKATFRVAIDNGPNVETAFVPVEAWGQRAETIANQFSKGDRIALTASLRTSEWETPERTKKSRTYLNLESFNFIEPHTTIKSVPDRDLSPQVQAF